MVSSLRFHRVTIDPMFQFHQMGYKTLYWPEAMGVVSTTETHLMFMSLEEEEVVGVNPGGRNTTGQLRSTWMLIDINLTVITVITIITIMTTITIMATITAVIADITTATGYIQDLYHSLHIIMMVMMMVTRTLMSKTPMSITSPSQPVSLHSSLERNWNLKRILFSPTLLSSCEQQRQCPKSALLQT